VTAAARAQFAGARVARLATVTADGTPRLVPIVFALDGDTIYSGVDGKPKRNRRLRRLTDIAARPRVAVLADEYAEDWSRLWWVRADGTASVHAASPVARAALIAKYPQYAGGVALDGPFLHIAVDRWTGWAATPPAG
jgi:PPOX class probable F420-dependent enzyme